MAGKAKPVPSKKHAARKGAKALHVNHRVRADAGAQDAHTANAPVEFAIGSRLRKLRKMKGLTLDVLAAEIGLTKGYLSKVETGQKVPPIATLARVARACDRRRHLAAGRQGRGKSRCDGGVGNASRRAASGRPRRHGV